MTRKNPETNPPSLAAEQARAIRRKLLAWYRKDHRQLPWRAEPPQTPNPYHVLVSEAMLQQTQVATVVGYFERFIAALPTIHALANADEQQVLRLWQGLGYYRRARNLHAAAGMIVSEFDGRVPCDVESLLRLPGVGRYTAGAIASIAYDRPTPIVDGNVERVLARLMHLREPVDKPAVKKHLWSLAEQLVPARSGAGDLNQSMMELGATVCTPKLPRCFVCPLRRDCRGVQETDPQTLPIKPPKRKPVAVTHVVFAIERGGKYLLEQRPATGLWANMWQLPTWENPPPEVLRGQPVRRSRNGSTPSAVYPTRNPDASAEPSVVVPTTANRALSTWYLARFNINPSNLTFASDFNHQTSHRKIRFVVFHGKAEGRLKPNSGRWRRLNHLDDLPLANPQHKAIKTLGAMASADSIDV
ncbi:MAG: A/G-specific adenine glycosylase [Planctomycetota bacterium]